jgi:hypothetical protein
VRGRRRGTPPCSPRLAAGGEGEELRRKELLPPPQEQKQEQGRGRILDVVAAGEQGPRHVLAAARAPRTLARPRPNPPRGGGGQGGRCGGGVGSEVRVRGARRVLGRCRGGGRGFLQKWSKNDINIEFALLRIEINFSLRAYVQNI